MIIISAGEGLGNQMFEYAFYLKIKHVYKNTDIKIDNRYAFWDAHNGYEVERIFDLKSDKASWDEVKSVADVDYLENTDRFLTVPAKIKRKMNFCKKSMLIQKDRTEYYEKFFTLDGSKSYYLYGPFANHRYFEDIKEEVLSAYSFPKIDDENKVIADSIMNTESVSIHIRRGDYIDLGVDLLEADYYSRAISRLTEITGLNIEDFSFFVFSDDIMAAKEILGEKNNFYYVKGNEGIKSFRDMQLMSLCKYNIISNSTFGFWGAYLNRNTSKAVIGPGIPFKGFKNPFTCEGWLQI